MSNKNAKREALNDDNLETVAGGSVFFDEYSNQWVASNEADNARDLYMGKRTPAKQGEHRYTQFFDSEMEALNWESGQMLEFIKSISNRSTEI